MYILYADEAGNTGTDYDNKNQPIFSLSGIIVDTKEWVNLNSLITNRKKLIIPEYPDCELHATEIYNGQKYKNGTYDFRKFSLERNLSIMEELVDLVVEIDCPIITFIVRKENLKNYCKAKYGSTIKIDPYLIAFPYVSIFFDYFIFHNDNSMGMIFLDNEESVSKSIDVIFNKLKFIEDITQIYILITNIIESALFVDSKKSNFIQLSDICNFYINRYNAMKFGAIPNKIKQDHIIKMYKKFEHLILPPPMNPEELKSMLVFFEDNKEILGAKK